MVRRTSTSEPANVAHKFNDILLQFPNAAIDGVEWNVLVKKFEERHSTKLDVISMGFDSPLAAAATLLWEVGQIRDAKDFRNPIVALEDAIALTPRPGSMGSWPSLYQSLCDIVLKHGSSDSQPSLLLSQLKPLLQSHWHASIDEHWGYFDSRGRSVKTKKMKHLIQAVLSWRNERIAKNSSKPTQIDDALVSNLELVPSDRHNDLLLRMAVHDKPCPEVISTGKCLSLGTEIGRKSWADVEDARDDEEQDDCKSLVSSCPYDDPFEPPPQKNWNVWDHSTPSTMCSTPLHCTSYSGSSTPMSKPQGTYAFMPVMLCNFVSNAGSAFGDICSIPTGTVQQLRTKIEGAGTAAPLAPVSHRAWK